MIEKLVNPGRKCDTTEIIFGGVDNSSSGKRLHNFYRFCARNHHEQEELDEYGKSKFFENHGRTKILISRKQKHLSMVAMAIIVVSSLFASNISSVLQQK